MTYSDEKKKNNPFKKQLFMNKKKVIYCALKLVTMNSNILSPYDNLIFGIESYEERSDTFLNNIESILNPQ